MEPTRAALERFEWLVDRCADQVSGACPERLAKTLVDASVRTSSKERALVILGLLGTVRAQAVLRWFDPAGQHWRVRLLHRLATRACANRLESVRQTQSSRRRAA
ncbi:hypothetical protein FIV42_06105 [Persicimonas caeni]|uniref:Uncharacterized protein n=1 Tax=Persicimonas caeni TaxID=2292766 RepID=A0A4Y6PPW5_PERCE|nr:hypothetical protein [Persicimonas caeni]QDG50320.1 hypothetical protein FIV42_06105 [Persicimonas caeni]QED31541.1 hypothetical protein FRD00_06100 [Persicimonas caeni]